MADPLGSGRKEMSKSKYVAMREEVGTWSVMNVAEAMPAVVDGIPQIGFTNGEAEDIAQVLNEMTSDDEG